MNYSIEIDTKTEKTVIKWKKSNPILFRKLRDILEDMMSHPRTGIGHPEPLIGGENAIYSRRISAHDRIIYKIYDDRLTILVISVSGHYSDK